jgi:hypothetical protein
VNYAVAKLEFSVDPLSDTTPAWTDITRYCMGMSWFSGVSKDTDSPEAGGATFVLKNLQRRFEPEYAAGAYYPNIVPGRRFRITVTADGVARVQGTYYAREWKVEYPDPSLGYSTVTVSCSDGFWRLSQDVTPTMTPPTAETYADVVKPDNPFAFYLLNEESGNVFKGDPGVTGKWSPGAQHILPNPIAGSPDRAVSLPFFITAPYGRVQLADIDTFADQGAFTVEAVSWQPGTSVNPLAAGPWIPSLAELQFQLNSGFAGARINTGATSVNVQAVSTAVAGFHHYAASYDQTTLKFYRDGVLVASNATSGIIQPAPGPDFIYIGQSTATGSGWSDTITVSGVAFYTYPLTAAQIAAHADAAINRGYRAQTSGTRIAALATDPLWSTAGIPAGSVTVAPVMQHGQPVIDEITSAASVEAPDSVFYFNDAGNPSYQGLLDTWTPAAIFGDQPSEVNYSSLDLVYDDALFNNVTVSGPGLAGVTKTNAQSLADYGNLGNKGTLDLSDLPIIYQSDANLIAQTWIDRFSTPSFRIASLSLNGQDQDARTQILTREIGDVIRVKRRGEGGTVIDIITRILGKEKSLDPNGDLRCTWSLARGFNVSTLGWRLNVAGISELGQTTSLA